MQKFNNPVSHTYKNETILSAEGPDVFTRGHSRLFIASKHSFQLGQNSQGCLGLSTQGIFFTAPLCVNLTYEEKLKYH